MKSELTIDVRTREIVGFHIGDRSSRLVRKTLSFSKKSGNHIGAIWGLIHHYNATLRAKAAAKAEEIRCFSIFTK